MKVSDLIHGRTSGVDLVRVTTGGFPKTLVPLSEVVLHHTDSQSWLLSIGEDVWEVDGASAADRDSLRNLRSGALHRLCWLVQKTPDRGEPERLTLKIHEFVGVFDWPEPVRIGIDDRIVEDMRRHRQQLNSVESLVKWLSERLLIHPQAVGGPVRALIAGSPSAAGGQQVAFRIYGKGLAADVASGPDNRLRVTRVATAKRAQAGDDARPIYLASGDIAFCDLTLAGEFRGSARDEIAARAQQAGSYLRLWNDYNTLEWQTFLTRARALGWLRYRRCEQLPDGVWRFHLDEGDADAQTIEEKLRFLGEDRQGVELEAGESIPAVLQGTSEESQGRDARNKPFLGVPSVRLNGPRVQIDLRAARVREDRIPPKTGWLFASLGGDQTRINRRLRAWENIRACTNPMPQIGLMIEGAPVPVRAHRRREPVTPAVWQVLPHPTDRQRLALDVALNTPDIALIQGPPGTGKTRVIAALQARLADRDELESGGGLSGNTLLTSFQHDAVENAAAATRVLGLPAIKVGYRKGAEDSNLWLERWKRETAESVRAARAERGETPSVQRALEEVRRLTVLHIEAPGPQDASLDLLNRVRELAGDWLSGEIKDRIDDLQGRLRAPDALVLGDEDRADALRAVRGLRTEAVPFSDDGPTAAYRTLRCLDRLDGFAWDAGARSLLDEAAGHDPDIPPTQALLDGLAHLRDTLIDRLNDPGERMPVRPIHADVADLCAEIVDALTERARTSPDGVDMAVAGWLEALEQDPEGIRDTVAHYTMVYAATCQQAVSNKMNLAKSGEDMVFRTVVIDEAARANPLDLFIPMALAERRIVLVGDHRQLPHALEPEVERGLVGTTDAAMQDALKRSLFERLFRDLREREQRDGIKRTVTLDTQYRMHPILGAFVSQHFYEPYGEALVSGREAGDFAHRVALADGTSLDGLVGAWIQIPKETGLEDRGQSKRRPVEAQRAAQEARAILAADPNLSVGVITFYAAQRDLILEEMESLDLFERDGEDGWRVRNQWEMTSDRRERLRVGTVDAFQGKEFDVVLLSITRSNHIAVTDEESRRKRYGFLLLENRLCVAMSRQQRLLIVLGDPDMVRGEEAEQSVPALAAFAKLCEEGVHGRIVRS